jgi:hypothetical protein
MTLQVWHTCIINGNIYFNCDHPPIEVVASAAQLTNTPTSIGGRSKNIALFNEFIFSKY